MQYFVYSKQKAKNLGFYAISSGVGIDFLPAMITDLHKILINCIHLNDNIISYPPNPIFYILIGVHKLQDPNYSEEWTNLKIRQNCWKDVKKGSKM